MFDIGFWELAVIGLIALLVLGPERLPRAARTAGMWMGRARRMLSDVKADIDREIRASELKEIADVKDLKSSFEKAAGEFEKSGRAATEFANRDVINEPAAGKEGAAAAAGTSSPPAPPAPKGGAGPAANATAGKADSADG